MALKPVIPPRRKPGQSAHSLGLLRALADAAQSHAEGQVLAEHVHARFSRACVVLARASRGWQVVGAAGVPDGTPSAQLGMQVPGTIEPDRWLHDLAGGQWVRHDLSHGRRIVARLLVRSARIPDELQRDLTVAGPVLAAAYPRPAGSSALELYLAQIVHDLRQPLGTLKLAHSMMRQSPVYDPHLLDRCQRALHDLGELMDDLLSFAAPARTKKRGHVPLRLGELVAQVVDDHQAHARLRGVELRVDVRADPTVLGSPLGLRRAIANVLDNALEHTTRGGHVVVRVDVDFHQTLIEVQDDGPGVAVPLREQVFEPFFTTRQSGNGLGLAVVRLVAQAHGGTARFVDAGGGACLRFSIPHQPSANGLPV
jgi:signal transduction histidine kinase